MPTDCGRDGSPLSGRRAHADVTLTGCMRVQGRAHASLPRATPRNTGSAPETPVHHRFPPGRQPRSRAARAAPCRSRPGDRADPGPCGQRSLRKRAGVRSPLKRKSSSSTGPAPQRAQWIDECAACAVRKAGRPHRRPAGKPRHSRSTRPTSSRTHGQMRTQGGGLENEPHARRHRTSLPPRARRRLGLAVGVLGDRRLRTAANGQDPPLIAHGCRLEVSHTEGCAYSPVSQALCRTRTRRPLPYHGSPEHRHDD
jgi:hypothetical protein